ncbi:hypothetical protein V501_05273 [Pseudogymnoascus sp. VKM F-4519 (FW-2642)]|nr:hypothetical protein V501_05273 [Pseudogymnoascus sp. VKM F-4519 (FW-2642)]
MEKESAPERSPSPATESTKTKDEDTTPQQSDQDVAPAPTPLEPEKERTALQTAVLMFALCASVFLAALDVTIVTTALPTISSYFKTSMAYTWVGSAYMLSSAASTPIWGKVSDIWGRKPILLVVSAIFFFGSALAAAAINIDMLIAGRAVQGLGGGGLLTLVNICISDLFSMRNRAKYYGFIGMTWAFASAIGPILGGVLTEKVSWRWCFYINLPITGVAFFIIAFLLHLDTPKTPVVAGLLAVDWLGSISIAGATVMFLLGLTLGGVIHPWDSPIVLCLLIFGPLLFVVFLAIEWKVAKYPIMPLEMFENTSNIASLLGVFFHGMMMVIGSFFVPLYFQSVLGATALLSGVWLLPLALSLSFSSAGTGLYISKTGRYMDCIRVAFTLSVLGFGLLYDLPLGKTWSKIIIYQIICGLGVGPNFQSLLLALQNQVKPHHYASVTATLGFTRNLATAIGVVVGNVVFQNSMLKQEPHLKANLSPQAAEMLSGKNAEASVFFVNTLPALERDIARAAYYASLRNVWLTAIAFAAAGLISCIFIKGRKLSKVHEKVETGLAAEERKARDRKAAAEAKTTGEKDIV